MNIFSKKSGFSLIELLTVITIIGILATITIVSFGSARQKARDGQRKQDLTKIRDAIELYYNDHNGYPIPGTEGGGFDARTYGWPPDNFRDWPGWFKTALEGGGYIQKLPIDPVNSHQYMYAYGVSRTYEGDASEYGKNYYLTAVLENQNDSSMVTFSTFKEKITNVTPGSSWCSCRDRYYSRNIKWEDIGACMRKVYMFSSGNWDYGPYCGNTVIH